MASDLRRHKMSVGKFSYQDLDLLKATTNYGEVHEGGTPVLARTHNC